jgi:hypothetical protein
VPFADDTIWAICRGALFKDRQMLRPLRSVREMLCLAAILVATSSANAWNSPGHMIVGLIAFDQLDPATKGKAIALLRRHPRFDDHFQEVMRRDRAVSREDDRIQQGWLFAYAGTWPDVVRDAKGAVNHEDVSRFNRPYWHYINEPVFLNDDERRQLLPTLRTNRRREPPQDPDEPNMNIIQAVKNSSRIVGDAAAPAESRAVHLCWLNHLTGDSHQPMHSCALYTTHRFRGGDRGGNLLEFQHEWNLHGFWDDQISSDEPFETLRVLATDLQKNAELAALGKLAASTIDIDKWIDESRELALRYAYSKEVLQKVADREGHSHLGPLNLSAAYSAEAESLAERRAIEAGYRLAKLFQQLLK